MAVPLDIDSVEVKKTPNKSTGWGPQDSLCWFISSLTMVYGRYNYSQWGL